MALPQIHTLFGIIIGLVSVVKALSQVDHPGTISNFCPEAMGVNVFRTAKSLGIPMERNPQRRVFKVVLVFHPKIKG